MAQRKRAHGRARLQEVARVAGVSPITVSRALRQPDIVSATKRDLIKRAIAKIGYLHNGIASGLASSRTTLVGLIVPTLVSPVLGETVHGISDALNPRGYTLTLGISEYDLEQEERLIRGFLEQRVCGMLVHGTRHTKTARALLSNAKIPVIEIGNLIKKPLDSVVSYSSFAAAKAITEHLCKKYRRIAIVDVPAKVSDRAQGRKKGYIAALEAAGLPVHRDLMIEDLFGQGAGGRAIAALVQMEPKVDAVIFCNSPMSLEALSECSRRGWNIPDKIAVAAINDSPLAESFSPGLTTIRIPRYKIGRLSGDLLLDRIDGKATKRITDVGFELVVRGSA